MEVAFTSFIYLAYTVLDKHRHVQLQTINTKYCLFGGKKTQK